MAKGKKQSTNVHYQKFYKQLQVCKNKIDAMKAANKEVDKALCEVYEHLQVKAALNWYSTTTGFICNNNKWHQSWTEATQDLEKKVVNHSLKNQN